MNPDLKDDETYIYESPDGGKTVYARLFGDDPSNRFQVSDDGDISWNNPWEDAPEFDTYLIHKYPELKKKYKIANIENTNLRKSDISIISDTLEVTEKPEQIIKNIISSTKKVIILRTFLSSEEKVKIVKNKKILDVPYFINCFSYNMIIEYFIKNNFFPQIYPDLATNLSQENEIFPNVKRRFFIVVFTKKNYLIRNFKTKVYKKLFSNKN